MCAPRPAGVRSALLRMRLARRKPVPLSLRDTRQTGTGGRGRMNRGTGEPGLQFGWHIWLRAVNSSEHEIRLPGPESRMDRALHDGGVATIAPERDHQTRHADDGGSRQHNRPVQRSLVQVANRRTGRLFADTAELRRAALREYCYSMFGKAECEPQVKLTAAKPHGKT